MITDEERAQLTILDEQEADFYAGLLFLGLLRLDRARQGPVDAAKVREIVVGVYKDLNAKMEEDPV